MGNGSARHKPQQSRRPGKSVSLSRRIAAQLTLASIVLLALAWVAVLAGPVRAEAPGAQVADTPPDLTVYLLTIGPGPAVYERFGHNAIWIHDPSRGTDRAFNFGFFDLGESGFIARFLRGRMYYWLEVLDAQPMIRGYEQAGRAVWIQRLNLTGAQKSALRDALERNALPQNRRYLYDYYLDNCSTRVRDALDRVLGGQIRRQLETLPAGTTYRWHTRRIMQYDPILYLALLAVLGQPTDRPLNAWEECFLPEQLQQHLRQVTVSDEHGRSVPLVAAEASIAQGRLSQPPDGPADWVPGFLAISLLLGLILLGLGWLSRISRVAKWVFLAIGGLWAMLMGAGGTFLAWAWLCTSHIATYRNENLLHCSPLALPLVVLLPALSRGIRWARAWAPMTMGLVVSTGLIGLLLKLIPGFSQVNSEVIAFTLPANLMLLGTVRLLASAQQRPETGRRPGSVRTAAGSFAGRAAGKGRNPLKG